jgi:hypothetical protein
MPDKHNKPNKTTISEYSSGSNIIFLYKVAALLLPFFPDDEEVKDRVLLPIVN